MVDALLLLFKLDDVTRTASVLDPTAHDCHSFSWELQTTASLVLLYAVAVQLLEIRPHVVFEQF